MTKLQLACDQITADELMKLMPQLLPYVDIFEMGTPFVFRHGLEAIKRLRKEYPNIQIWADIKIVDGVRMTRPFFEAGVNCITTMAMTDISIIKGCAELAHEYGGKIEADMMFVKNIKEKVAELESVGADIIAIHSSFDKVLKNSTQSLEELKSKNASFEKVVNTNAAPITDFIEMMGCVQKASTSVSGFITLDKVRDYLEYKPDKIIVGAPILLSDDIVGTTRKYAEILRKQ